MLAICLDNGRMQLMRYESDDNAVCIDTGIKPCKCKWNMNGTILAVAGFQLGGGGEVPEPCSAIHLPPHYLVYASASPFLHVGSGNR